MSRSHSRPSSDLSEYNESIFLPYTVPFHTDKVPCVDATINGTRVELPVDTGSTGLFISVTKLPNLNFSNAPRGYQYLTSSFHLYTGRVVELQVVFHGSNGHHATSTVPVLVVERSVKCKWYNAAVDKGHCPPHPNDPSIKPIERDISRIIYMGVGFGRNKLNEDRAIALPRGNPFLNVDSLNGRKMSPCSFRAGYTISTRGIHLGLTHSNNKDFLFTDLAQGVAHDTDARDWAMVDMCLSVNGNGVHCGSGLIDTGISQMYIRTKAGTEIPHTTTPSSKGDGYIKRVISGTKIAIGFPAFKEAVAEYSFVVGGGSPLEPKHVVPGKQGPPPYVNTGRNLLFRYEVAFDAVGGRFGFRRMSNSAEPWMATALI